jgi:hypothetical protein
VCIFKTFRFMLCFREAAELKGRNSPVNKVFLFCFLVGGEERRGG